MRVALHLLWVTSRILEEMEFFLHRHSFLSCCIPYSGLNTYWFCSMINRNYYPPKKVALKWSLSTCVTKNPLCILHGPLMILPLGWLSVRPRKPFTEALCDKSFYEWKRETHKATPVLNARWWIIALAHTQKFWYIWCPVSHTIFLAFFNINSFLSLHN